MAITDLQNYLDECLIPFAPAASCRVESSRWCQWNRVGQVRSAWFGWVRSVDRDGQSNCVRLFGWGRRVGWFESVWFGSVRSDPVRLRRVVLLGRARQLAWPVRMSRPQGTGRSWSLFGKDWVCSSGGARWIGLVGSVSSFWAGLSWRVQSNKSSRFCYVGSGQVRPGRLVGRFGSSAGSVGLLKIHSSHSNFWGTWNFLRATYLSCQNGFLQKGSRKTNLSATWDYVVSAVLMLLDRIFVIYQFTAWLYCSFSLQIGSHLRRALSPGGRTPWKKLLSHFFHTF